MSPPHVSRKRWLIVEGQDDQFVTIELLARHGAFWGDKTRDADEDLPYVKVTDGVAAMADVAAIQLKSTDRIGIIFDADRDGAKQWASVCKRLKAIETPPPWLANILPRLPIDVPSDGLILEHENRALGAWAMPDNRANGTLEDFLFDLVPGNDGHWPHARKGVEDAMQRGVKFKNQYRSKAEIHTWLAWQEDPGLPFGAAVKRKIFLHDTDTALRFVAWFRRVFPVNPLP